MTWTFSKRNPPYTSILIKGNKHISSNFHIHNVLEWPWFSPRLSVLSLSLFNHFQTCTTSSCKMLKTSKVVLLVKKKRHYRLPSVRTKKSLQRPINNPSNNPKKHNLWNMTMPHLLKTLLNNAITDAIRRNGTFLPCFWDFTWRVTSSGQTPLRWTGPRDQIQIAHSLPLRHGWWMLVAISKWVPFSSWSLGWCDTVDGSEIRPSPVEVGSLSHYWQSFMRSRWCRIPSINSSSPDALIFPDL